MDFLSEYESKLFTPDEAVRCVKDGDWVDYTGANGFPVKLDEALARRRDELRRVRVQGNLMFGPIQAVECDPSQEHFVYNTWHCSGYERKLCDRGLCFFTPMVFRNLSWYYRQFLHVNVAMMTVGPMDRHGYFNLSCATGMSKFILDQADIVIVEVNEHAPRLRGGFEEVVHISDVDMVVESGLDSYRTIPAARPKAEDIQIASYILPHIMDGATIQLGIGGLPNALGEQIAKSELRDLGMHTELCSDAYLSMFLEGKLTNRRKTLNKNKGVAGLVTGSQALYDWLDDNPGIMTAPLSYVNDPAVIAQNDNMISINGCVSADLYGQVCSESSGTRQISGTGGQLDFLTGAAMSRGGKAFLCMTSSYSDHDGVRYSRIVPTFNGDIVTSPRSQAYYIATEYGCVNLAGKSTWERAAALISIAHPDFRDELIRAAEAQKIWLPENKR
ncbi:MAG TPA: acetyl-CoA hydrolase/transferase C-terminal domain-containing protein [Oscillospiraceae bacterium]|nr:acetyl-CoA hydrolase/transferase C-terminal domain-containing protein [Oscillospiraceae bacterium]